MSVFANDPATKGLSWFQVV